MKISGFLFENQGIIYFFYRRLVSLADKQPADAGHGTSMYDKVNKCPNMMRKESLVLVYIDDSLLPF